MDISYNELKNKEVVNLCDGAKLSRIIDIIFDSEEGKVRGVVVPGEKKFLKKCDELFIPLEKIRRIGDDVILIRYELTDTYYSKHFVNSTNKKQSLKINRSVKDGGDSVSFIRYRKMDNKKYK